MDYGPHDHKFKLYNQRVVPLSKAHNTASSLYLQNKKQKQNEVSYSDNQIIRCEKAI
uniref:Uncharacterized protein n=1 Tax=Octopus bimaculoides TaxID=37653 RepID=A0A0L8H4Y7_OCTBM